MKPRNSLEWLVAFIAAVTVVSGLTQMVAPGFVLAIVGGQATPTSEHFFGIIGMFMLLFGGALLQEVLSTPPQPIVALWAALQKAGAVAAVCLGVYKHIFSPLALLVCGFDLISAAFVFAYWWRVRQTG